MKDLALHRLTRQQLEQFAKMPSHAVVLVGPTGSGKRTLAIKLAEQVLKLPDASFADHPYGLIIASEDGKAIGIEAVRQLEQFLALKVPSHAIFDRAIIIEDAHLLTLEAQNALLKTLEEPPVGTILVLTVTHQQAVLPTIRSRMQSIAVGRLERDELMAYFDSQDFDQKTVQQAYAISGGLPGLMYALLHETDHPLMEATIRARQLLSQSTYERLLVVDELAKQRQLAIDIVFILQQMAHVSLQTASGPASRKWQTVLETSYHTREALTTSAQPKLALTDLMLNL
jgi:ribose 1,5-bisphosphokinase PhnN